MQWNIRNGGVKYCYYAAVFLASTVFFFSCDSEKEAKLTFELFKSRSDLDTLTNLSELVIKDGLYFKNSNLFDGEAQELIIDTALTESEMVPCTESSRDYKYARFKKGVLQSTSTFIQKTKESSKLHIKEHQVLLDLDSSIVYHFTNCSNVPMLTRSIHRSLEGKHRTMNFYFPKPSSFCVQRSEEYYGEVLRSESFYSLEGTLLKSVIDNQQYAQQVSGWQTTLTKEGKELKEEYINGSKTGAYQLFHDNGELEVVKDVEQGVFKRYYSSGRIEMSCKLHDGELHGEAIYYTPDGAQWKRYTYKKGVMEGPWEIFYKNGTTAEKGKKKNGVEIGPYFSFHPSGLRAEEITYELSNKDTTKLFQSWYKNGNLEERYSALNAVKHGKLERWYDNKQKRIETYYSLGKIHGKFLNWTKDGALYKEGYYYRNREVSAEEFQKLSAGSDL